VKQTDCDSLAIAIGTSHGAYKFAGEAKLDLGRLQVIRELVKIPLVLHGASSVPSWLVDKVRQFGGKLEGTEGVPEDQLVRSISLGICKINTDTDLRLAFVAGMREFLMTHPDDVDPRHILNAGKASLQQVVEHRIELFGSKGKA
jgi:fructose-bisphosphate aldolase class II